MTTSRPSQFADQPFDVAVVGTESLVENWLKARKVTDSPEFTVPKKKPWYYGCIGGVPIPTLIRRLWQNTRDGVRTNRYGLPAHFYTTLWITLWLASVGQLAVAVPEAFEMARDQKISTRHPDYRGPGCGQLPIDRAYRIFIRSIVNSLPLLVSLTIFFFPALVKA